MRRIVLAGGLAWGLTVGLTAAGCGGAKVPAHSGYKSEKAKPWTKPKRLEWDDKMEARDDGELNYADFRRARWYAVDLTAPGDLTLRLETSPLNDEINEEFDLAMEVLDPGNRVISKADLEEDDAGELNKMRTLRDLSPGRYLIHLYLQGRLDIAEYELKVAFKPTGASKSDFPAQVAFLEPLPMVPINDDTPANARPTPKPNPTPGKKPPVPRPKPADEPAPAATTLKARIMTVSVAGDKTRITVGGGTANGVAAGWKAKIAGLSGTFSVEACTDRTCTILVPATPDQVKAGGGTVTLSP